jgi:hypothetical protein
MDADGKKHGMHKYDPGTYTVHVFSSIGRPMGKTLKHNYISSVKLAERWKKWKGGSAVISKCVYNGALHRPCYPEKMQ